MQEQFHFEPAPLVDLGLFCFKLDPAHWEAREYLGEKVMMGSTGGMWVASMTGEQFPALEETWKNDVSESARGFVVSGDHRGVGLQALAARTLGRYLGKEVREKIAKGTDSLEAPELDEVIRDCTPVRPGMRERVTDPYPPIDAANDVCAVYDCLAVLAWLQNHGKEYLLEEKTRYAEVSRCFSVSRMRHSM
jgi:hypothetical protein